QFLGAYCQRRPLFCIRIPYFAAYSFCAICERASRYFKRLQRFNRRRCAADWKGNRFSNQKLCTKLGWKPRVSMNDAIERFLAQFVSGQTSPMQSPHQEISALGNAVSETT